MTEELSPLYQAQRRADLNRSRAHALRLAVLSGQFEGFLQDEASHAISEYRRQREQLDGGHPEEVVKAATGERGDADQ